MTSFSATEHPRAGDGTFTEKHHSAPEEVLDDELRTEQVGAARLVAGDALVFEEPGGPTSVQAIAEVSRYIEPSRYRLMVDVTFADGTGARTYAGKSPVTIVKRGPHD